MISRPQPVRSNADLLIVFVKAPRPGLVKTRLARELGFDGAALAYRQLAEKVLSTIGSGMNVELRFSPDDAGIEIRPWLRPGWRATPQGAGDLGERLDRAFADAFAAGAERVLIIGSDCPEMTTADLSEAWMALRTVDLVLGPARDGGYWLIGLRGPQPGLFRNIPWSTDRVLRMTEELAQASGLELHLLRELNDIDSISDWTEWLQRQHAR
ncbi:MAG: TIGR04282 family arsenosugar biosynthesis glycosyltransferase [Verrucomicrobiota bacterium]|jgi:uncharacterized protein